MSGDKQADKQAHAYICTIKDKDRERSRGREIARKRVCVFVCVGVCVCERKEYGRIVHRRK